ncbi:pseudouridine synthase [Effusibacillus lacus]|uniref:Pseudouridine synthase n=1 Tax=Effusibacillus lacus TaxID=1348429 RepID=A0A292YL54_9BACL|nr:pseudouridine synthase [Effusibacillus lacus]TCS76289.1 ribosomal large subunit pseudouridine synthase B [Effusibacillus lacus]GAX91837.1 pseudouridine synthase [Effusibacillus lacus]
MERLQKVLAQAGVASRRKCEELIVSGRVTVNGLVIRELGTKVDPELDRIELDGKPIEQEPLVYILLNKPIGVVTTASDPEGRKTVIEIVQVKERVFPVGRLDMNTSGLLLLTNDGELANGLMHPRHEVDKKYIAEVKGSISEEALAKLANGILLEDGLTAPAKVKLLKRTAFLSKLEITIHEGRNRQVRRMCEAVGHPVQKLKRVQVAFLTLGGLPPGGWRYLTDFEVKRLYEIAGKSA